MRREWKTHFVERYASPIAAPRCAKPPAVPALSTMSGRPSAATAAYVLTAAAFVATLFTLYR